MQSFSEIGILETRTLTVGLKRLLGTTDVLTDGDVTVTVAVYDKSGDLAGLTSGLLSGSAQVNVAPVTIKGVTVPIGQAILQSVDATHGTAGCTYVLTYEFEKDGETITEDVLFTIVKYVPK